jgi:prophage antirepressor-like protein
MPRKIQKENTSSIVAKEIIPFDFGKLTLTTIVDGDGNPWWVSSEVCKVLGYKNSPDAVARHCFNPQKMTIPKRYSQRGGAQFNTIINEPDLYRIISHSQLPAAKDFECWIMEKVIPSIRKTGSYTMPASGKPMSHLENISQGLLSATCTVHTARSSRSILANSR